MNFVDTMNKNIPVADILKEIETLRKQEAAALAQLHAVRGALMALGSLIEEKPAEKPEA